MNILYINTTDVRGGAASVIWTIKRAADKAGHATSMLVRDKYSSDPSVTSIDPGRITRWSSIARADDVSGFGTETVFETDAYRKADIVHVCNLHGRYFDISALDRIAREKRLIWSMQDLWPLTPHCSYPADGEPDADGFYACESLRSEPRMLWRNEKTMKEAKRAVYEKASMTIVTPSRWTEAKVRNSVLAGKDIRTIPNGVDLDIFRLHDKGEARKALGLPQDRQILLFVAHDAERNPFKGWQYAKEAISARPDTTGICIGSRRPRTEGNIIYLPFIDDRHRLALHYAAAEAFLFPTLNDTFGLVGAESLACGTPVVAFGSGGVPEVVEHLSSGFVAKRADAADFERGVDFALAAAHDDPQGIRSRCRARGESFSASAMTAAYLALYDEAAKPR